MAKPWHEMKEKLDSVSPSLCLAKWTQVTMHLQNGHTQSCHHPSTHKIPLEELKDNPSALHNTNFKKEKRKEMLNGVKPKECDYCWRIEDAAPGMFSDRHYKSSFSWSHPHFNKIAKMSGDENFDPTYVEVSFGNACNFKCMYCAPHISSKWMEEIKQHGPYPTSDKYNNLEWLEHAGQMPIPNNQYNPYQEAFWKWWPRLYKSLHTFRITGGEPLMAKDTFQVLNYIQQTETPNKELLLGVNSNLGIPDKLIDKFIKGVREILDEKRVRKVELYTSAEAWDKRNDYIRYGMNYNNWINNLEKVIKALPEVPITMMCAYNALSISSFTMFLKDIELIREQYGKDCVYVDIPYVRHPNFMDCKIMKEGHMIKESWQYMKNSKWFDEDETAKMERIYRYWEHNKDNDHSKQRENLKLYLRELDKRRGTKFKSVFPEFEDYYNG
jgi:organic radical activating enzyme